MIQAYNDDFELIIPAGESRDLGVTVNFLMINSVSTLISPKVSIDGGKEFNGDAGFAHELKGDKQFNLVRFRNISAVEMTVAGKVSNGRIYNMNMVTFSEIPVRFATNNIESSACPVSDVAYEIIAHDGQREIHLQNNGLNDVWVGGDNVDANLKHGSKLTPNATTMLNIYGSVFVQCETGKSSVLSVNRLRTL